SSFFLPNTSGDIIMFFAFLSVAALVVGLCLGFRKACPAPVIKDTDLRVMSRRSVKHTVLAIVLAVVGAVAFFASEASVILAMASAPAAYALPAIYGFAALSLAAIFGTGYSLAIVLRTRHFISTRAVLTVKN